MKNKRKHAKIQFNLNGNKVIARNQTDAIKKLRRESEKRKEFHHMLNDE